MRKSNFSWSPPLKENLQSDQAILTLLLKIIALWFKMRFKGFIRIMSNALSILLQCIAKKWRWLLWEIVLHHIWWQDTWCRFCTASNKAHLQEHKWNFKKYCWKNILLHRWMRRAVQKLQKLFEFVQPWKVFWYFSWVVFLCNFTWEK